MKSKSFRFYCSDKENRDYTSFCLKTTYDIVDDKLVESKNQEDISFSDIYTGEVGKSSLEYPSDLVPFRPTTDIIVNMLARSPKGEPTESWVVGVRVCNYFAYKLKVYGERYWEPILEKKSRLELLWDDREKYHFRGWKLTDPKPVTEVKVNYENAFGG